MDDDELDELLDEIEKKLSRSATVAPCGNSTEPGRCGKDTDGRTKHCATNPEQPASSISAEIDSLLKDLMEEDSSQSDQPKTKQHPGRTEVDKSSSSQSGSRKCCPVFIGGTSVINGIGTATSQRSCDQLRCISCDFRVLTFDDSEWDSTCDYLFLRNNMPDCQKLRRKLRRRRGVRSYACQCSWISALEPTDLRDHPQLTWVCGKHQE